MTAREALRQFMELHGYDHLKNADIECGCDVDDLCPCESDCCDCELVKHEGKEKEKI